MVSRANTAELIPEKARWEIATKGLTGAYIAISNALKQAVGQNKFEEFNGSLWREAGQVKLTKNMVRGDSHCEWVVERK
jgi:hypothetical protein